jgi:uncharacterized phage-associated protein
MAENLSEKLLRELRELHLLRDDEIDTSDIPETRDWGKAVRGLWTRPNLKHRNFDVRALANAILKKAWSLGLHPTNMGLNKLTWFAFESAILELGEVLTEARAEAWEHGPVFREIYAGSRKFEDKPVTQLLRAFSKDTKKMEPAEEEFDSSIQYLIDTTLDVYGALSTAKLRALSHRERSAWYYVWHSAHRTSAGMVISPNIIIAAARTRSEANERE